MNINHLTRATVLAHYDHFNEQKHIREVGATLRNEENGAIVNVYVRSKIDEHNRLESSEFDYMACLHIATFEERQKCLNQLREKTESLTKDGYSLTPIEVSKQFQKVTGRNGATALAPRETKLAAYIPLTESAKFELTLIALKEWIEALGVDLSIESNHESLQLIFNVLAGQVDMVSRGNDVETETKSYALWGFWQ